MAESDTVEHELTRHHTPAFAPTHPWVHFVANAVTRMTVTFCLTSAKVRLWSPETVNCRRHRTKERVREIVL